MLRYLPEVAFQRDSLGGAVESLDRRILKLISDGESYDEAASILHMTRSSIDAAMARVRLSLNALTDEHAVALAIRSGLID